MPRDPWKGRPLALLASALVLWASTPPSVWAATPADDELRIGVASPLSGPIGHLGRDVERGAQMAVEEINARRLEVGGKPLRLTLVSMDDTGYPQQATVVATALVKQGVTAVVGHLNSGTTVAAAKVYDQAGVPQISPSATNPKFTRLGLERVYRLVADDLQVAQYLAVFAVKRLGARRIMLVDDRSAYGQGLADTFDESLRGQGLAAVSRHITNKSTANMQVILEAIASQQPDMVFYGGMDVDLGKLIQAAKQRDLKVQWMGGDGICSGELPRAASGLPDDQVYCSEPGGPALKPSTKYVEFVDHFKRKFGGPPILYASNAYDAVQVMAAAMVAVGSTDAKQWAPYLKTMPKMVGASGEVEFDGTGGLRQPYVSLFTYRGNVRVQIE